MHSLMCSTRSSPAPSTAMAAAPRPADDKIEAGDLQRARRLLTRAYAAGAVDLLQFEEALSGVFGARTVGDLTAATAVIPAPYTARLERADTAAKAAAVARARHRGEVRSYVRVMALLLGIWIAVGVTAGAWYPWPVWPALGWGIPLVAAGRVAPHDYDLRHGTFRTDPG